MAVPDTFAKMTSEKENRKEVYGTLARMMKSGKHMAAHGTFAKTTSTEKRNHMVVPDTLAKMASTGNVTDNHFTAMNEDWWVAYLDEEIADCEEDTPDYGLATIFKDMLLTSDHRVVADVARRIDAYYAVEFWPFLDPLAKFTEDKGMAGYLNAVYSLVFDLARLIPYKDSRQDMLVELILELRKLPPKPFKIWGVCYYIFINYPLSSALTFVARGSALCIPLNQFSRL
jgi:hypothetical protein